MIPLPSTGFRRSELRVLVWQWGRRGAGPRVAVEMARAVDGVPGCRALLSLSTGAEILDSADRPRCDLPMRTYSGLPSFLRRYATGRLSLWRLTTKIAALRPDMALCAMPGPLDLLMAAALKRLGVPILVVVHDADLHPGDGSRLQMLLQRRLVRAADGLVALTRHVADRLREQDAVGIRPLLVASLPPLTFGRVPPPPLSHGGRMRLLFFGRLLPYKGLDLLAEALMAPGLENRLEVRVVGQGPDDPALARLDELPFVSVENRWVPEEEVGQLIAWTDAVVLPYREASQSGVAAAAIAARRWVVSTSVGGLAEQFRHEPMALLCPPTAVALRDGIERLLRSPPPAPPLASEPERLWLEMADTLVRGFRTILPSQVCRRGPARAYNGASSRGGAS